MKISGFTMVRNATKYYFPIKESIMSILPLVDEFIIALGNNDEDDFTRKEIDSIGSPKIKIYDRIWSESDFKDSRIFADETNFALQQCNGEWCFYLQADEVIHESDHMTILNACRQFVNDNNVDGLLFKYHHFFGDYDHYLPVHGWYKNEMRIVKNRRGVYSIKDAQSFRKNNNEKLNVKAIDAYVYHYGWVRPPHMMQSKKKEHDSMHHGRQKAQESYVERPDEFEYGALGAIPIFKGSHPVIMNEYMKMINWKDRLNYSNKVTLIRPKMKHERLKYRIITFFENKLNGGRDFFGYKNWNLIK